MRFEGSSLAEGICGHSDCWSGKFGFEDHTSSISGSASNRVPQCIYPAVVRVIP